MSLTNPKNIVTEERLSEFYQTILPYLGGMPEVLANKFSKGDMYSTEEKMIGQWIDGKPLYQKSFANITVAGSTGRSYKDIVDLASCNVDTFVDAWGRWNDSGISKPYSMADQNERQTLCYKESTHYLQLLQYEGTSKMIGWVTVVYTKTTDSAISIGDDTDYSTDEKIVGTWIDRKPLYQKTIVLNNPSTDWTNVSLGLTGIDVILKVSSYAILSSGNMMSEHSWLDGSSKSYFTAMVYKTSNNSPTVMLKKTASDSITKVVMTVQYTKTTD